MRRFSKVLFFLNLFSTFENSGNFKRNRPYLELSLLEECLYLRSPNLGNVRLTIPVYIAKVRHAERSNVIPHAFTMFFFCSEQLSCIQVHK